MAQSKTYNMDCMEYLRTVPDKYFDLACVDPPYGGGGDDNEYKGAVVGRFGGRFEKYHLGESRSQNGNVERERNPGDKGHADGWHLGGKVQPSRGCL